ncbi:hypothetical protein ABZ714_07190 [Streptomyces sp. NPDC006798]|uniref:hypothetical protein n=1 Tax=Streptomyces sp. NPDC006798 TaxID=3155462 RepID=UPI0033F0C527
MAWTLSTGAAVTLSWWGVHTVMSGTAYDRPVAVPINAGEDPTTQAKPRVSETHRPPSRTADPPTKTVDSPGTRTPGRESVSDGGEDTTPGPATDRPTQGAPEPGATEEPVDSDPTGNLKGVTVDGGRVVFDMGPASAELVTATPNEGWRMQIWPESTYIRVTFTSDEREISVFAIWNGHPPRIDQDERPAP